MSRPRILVIDDDPTFRNLVVSLLRKEFVVFLASDGEEGFQKASEAPPDLVIVDIQMPNWDGLQTLRAFRGHPQLRRLPVVILTADASRETVVSAIQAGANDYIIKSAFSKDELLRKIQRAVLTAREAAMKPSAPHGPPAQPARTPAPHAAPAAAFAAAPLRTAAPQLTATSQPAAPAPVAAPSAPEPAVETVAAPSPVAIEEPSASTPESDPELQAVLDGWE